MGFLQDLRSRVEQTLKNYVGDQTFLLAAASSAAICIAADGDVEDEEVKAALAGLRTNKTLAASYTAAQVEDEVAAALDRTKTMLGRRANMRHIEAMAGRPNADREDVFLIAADCTSGNSHGLGEPEKKALRTIAEALSLNADKMLAS